VRSETPDISASSAWVNPNAVRAIRHGEGVRLTCDGLLIIGNLADIDGSWTIRPEKIVNALEAVGEAAEIHPDGTLRGSPGLRASWVASLPNMALRYRLAADPTIEQWIHELHDLAPTFRPGRAAELARGAPRGTGRKAIVSMLLEAAENGRPSAIWKGARFTARDQVDHERRKPKRGSVHHKELSLARAADRIVRRLTAFPAGIESTSDADRRAETRLLADCVRRS